MRHLLLPIALLALAGCKPEAPEGEPIRPVLTVEARLRDHETLGPFAGSIQPRYATDYSFRLFGRMVSRPVNIGSIVKPGDELAATDPSVQIQLARNADAAVVSAEAQLANAAAEEGRQRPLAERNITPQAQLDSVVQARETAAANLTRARTSLRRALDQLAYTRLVADFDGIVTAVYLDAGQVVNAGQKVMTIARPEIREAVIAVPPALADRLANSAKADGAKYETFVELDQGPKVVASGVRAVDPAADAATRTRNVYFSLDTPPESFRLGITVQVTLSQPVSPRIDLPATALLEKDGKTQVWIVTKPAAGVSTVACRDVAIVARDAGSVSVTGLTAGDRVVTVGVHSLSDGQKVLAP